MLILSKDDREEDDGDEAVLFLWLSLARSWARFPASAGEVIVIFVGWSDDDVNSRPDELTLCRYFHPLRAVLCKRLFIIQIFLSLWCCGNVEVKNAGEMMDEKKWECSNKK